MPKSILMSYWGSKCSKVSKCFYFVFLVGKKKHMFSLSGHLAFCSSYLLLKIHSIFPQKGHRLPFLLIWTSNLCIISYTDVSCTWIFGLIFFLLFSLDFISVSIMLSILQSFFFFWPGDFAAEVHVCMTSPNWLLSDLRSCHPGSTIHNFLGCWIHCFISLMLSLFLTFLPTLCC